MEANNLTPGDLQIGYKLHAIIKLARNGHLGDKWIVAEHTATYHLGIRHGQDSHAFYSH